MFEELNDILVKILILKPCLNDYCEKCKHSYWLDEDELRCRKIKLGSSEAMCVQIVRCLDFEIKNQTK